MGNKSQAAQIIERFEEELLKDWFKAQLNAPSLRKDLISDTELLHQSRHFLRVFMEGLKVGDSTHIDHRDWSAVRDVIADISESRARLGFSPAETANFLFSLKQPIFKRLRTELQRDPDALFQEIETISVLVDELGIYSTDISQKSREAVINRQQQEMIELSTPVVKLWDGILALPMIGTLDSRRTQVAMENLLQEIVNTGAEVAIIDITGVPTVDTLVAQHLLKTVAATRLMGAECILSGIRPQIAQTIVHLNIDLGKVATKASLADAFSLALKMRRLVIRPADPADSSSSRR